MPDSVEELAGHFAHVADKVAEIMAGPLADSESWPDDRRWWLQLGFNLGRFSELSGEGKPVWDAWKAAIESRDVAEIERLSAHLRKNAESLRNQ